MPEDTAKSRYHHGDLRHALIEAAESILLERGVEGFSLREAARRAGVSPAAPAHHFGDARGLLTVIATLGFEDLAAALSQANLEGHDRRARIVAQGHAYVRFAMTRPARFDLMWRRDLLDMDDPPHQAAGFRAYQLLHEAVTGQTLDPGCMGEDFKADPRVIAAWSMAHGFTGLARRQTVDPDTPGLLDGVLNCLDI